MPIAPTLFPSLRDRQGHTNCTFASIPHANDGTDGAVAVAAYHSDRVHARVHCTGRQAAADESSHAGFAAAQGSSQSFDATAAEAVAAQAEPPVLDLTFGVKHTSGFDERRKLLKALLESIRTRYATAPMIVAYDGEHTYDNATGRYGETYVRLVGASGLSAGRNAIVAAAATEFVMIMDDDVLFNDHTRVGVLLSHLRVDESLALVSGCYAPSDCYAHNLRAGPRIMMTKEVIVRSTDTGVLRSDMVTLTWGNGTSVATHCEGMAP